MRRELFADRFLRFPLLYFFVRSLLFSWRARIVTAVIALLALALILGLPRIWRTTPKDFTPEVRVSLLDELKARALERNARKYVAQGRVDYGLMAYNAAIAQNRGNLARQRTLVNLATKRQLERADVEMDTINVAALRSAAWVYRLTKRQEDLESAARLYDALEFDDDLLAMLDPEKENLSDPVRRLLAKAFLRQGFIDRFEMAWRDWSAAAGWEQNAEMRLYRAAATASFGSATKAMSARALLSEHLQEGEWKVLANRLFASVCFERRDLPEYLNALHRLESWRRDHLLEHARAWRLLAAAGRKDEARALADQFNRPPRTPLETSQLAAAYAELGMMRDAHKLLDQFIERFGFYERLWVQQATLFIAEKQWGAVRNLISRIRLNPAVAHRLDGFSYYLEGRAELGEGHRAAAAKLFREIPTRQLPSLEVALSVIDQLRLLGYPDVAATMVAKVEKTAGEYPRFWSFVMQLGSDLKDEALLLKATKQYLKLRPDDSAARSNFAAALLASRQRGSEAVKVTLEALALSPGLPAFQINHASALALNARYRDAEAELQKVELPRLGELERTMYYFTLTESLVGQGEFARARNAATHIDSRFLFPSQAEALRGWREKMEEGKQAAARN